jgi:hypothetical protein
MDSKTETSTVDPAFRAQEGSKIHLNPKPDMPGIHHASEDNVYRFVMKGLRCLRSGLIMMLMPILTQIHLSENVEGVWEYQVVDEAADGWR